LKHQQRLASTIDTGTSSNTSSSTRTGTQTNADLFVQNDGCLVLELQLQAQVYGCFWSPRYRFHLRPLFAHDPIEIEAAVAAAIAIGIEKEKKKEQLKRKGEQMMMMTCDEEELPQSRPEEQDPLRPWKKQRSYH
jgi:hypothetical protein